VLTLKRHPVPIEAFFEHSVVLAYAFPPSVLEPFLAPGLALDTFEGRAFLAIALVQTRGLRPAGFPSFVGRDFFLSGYRVFVQYRRPRRPTLRGLRILRSDTDSRVMQWAGNALTHYNYRHCRVRSTRTDRSLSLEVRTPRRVADLSLTADLGPAPEGPPPGSPFRDWRTARRFAGPLPFTFDYEEETRSLVLIQGVREHWEPRPVAVRVETATFFDKPPFVGVEPVLANAFYVERIPYRWKRGVVEAVPAEPA
jgi:hypothetical protein